MLLKKSYQKAKFDVMEFLHILVFICLWHSAASNENAPVKTGPAGPGINITIRVTNVLTASNYDESWPASLIQGQTLYDAMVTLQQSDQGFNFTSSTTKFGQFIESINGMEASSNDTQYWSILDGNDTLLQQGVSQTVPKQDDNYRFNMTTW